MLSRFVVSQVKHNSYFLVGVVLGLWVALACVPLEEDAAGAGAGAACAEPALAPDEFEPQREERPLGPAGQPGRSVQRPRYYSTELGMRGSVLAGVLSSEEALESRVAALNRTAAQLQPALRVFLAASAPQRAPARANVVGFTDTREMLKPFHALKYLADNYLDEYDFFFLVSDTSFVNARRLTDLVARLSVSQDVYMGTVADDDSHYCTLEGGILLSNSVLRAVHAELDWCVRNSYSPHHHENLGRCVLHAAHTHCTSAMQGEEYRSARLAEGAALTPALADAVAAHPVTEPQHFYTLHAYVSRVYLERGARAEQALRAALAASAAQHPRGARNASWPAGLRADPGLAPPPPPTRFDHLRWTLFNATHAFMPDDHRALGELTGATKEAVQLVVETALAWARSRWAGAEEAALLEGAWRWEPPTALRYRLLLTLRPRAAGPPLVRGVEAVRGLGAARLVAAPYVTEAARVSLVLPLRAADLPLLPAFLRRYESVCLLQDKNTALLVVVVGAGAAGVEGARAAAAALAARHRAALDVLAADAPAPLADHHDDDLIKTAVTAALARLPQDALVLVATPRMEYNQDFLNRVRMNTISGWQWFWAAAFARHAQFAHPRFVDASGARPQQHTGRFNLRHAAPLAAHRRDLRHAMTSWTGAANASLVEMLTATALRCLRAPDPALVLAPAPAPCGLRAGDVTSRAGDVTASCLRALRDDGFARLDLGDRHALSKLLLEDRAGVHA